MKIIKLLAVLCGLLISNSFFAQGPQAFKYQAVARDGAGAPLTNQAVSFQISILQGSASGASVYSETHNVSTNGFGLVNLEIGNGSTVSGNFSTIAWGSNSYFLEVRLDETGGTSYQLMGTSQLLSVPYALYAETAGSGGGGGATVLNDLTDVNSSGASTNQVLTWNGSSWVPTTPVDNNTTYSAGSGLTLSGTTFSNSAPDQTVTLTQGGATTISGTYPNFTISSTDNNTTYSAGTGLTLSGTTFSGPWTIASGNVYRNSGNVGIGNSAPAYNLDITHNSTGTTDNVAIFLDGEGFTDAGTNAFGFRSEFNGNGAASNFGVFSEMTGTAEATGANYGGYFSLPSGTAESLMGVRSQIGDGATVRNYAFYGHSAGTSATFNIGGIFIADGVSANDNYAIYAAGSNGGGGAAYAGYFDGDVTVTGTFSNPSDKKLKTNISDMPSALNKLKTLKVKSYDYIQDKTLKLPKGTQFGFIAQDMELVYPELVNNQKQIKMIDGKDAGAESVEYKAINYIGMVPILTKALQEQQELIEKLEKRIEELENK